VVNKYVLNAVVNITKICLVNKLWTSNIFKQEKNFKLMIVLIAQSQLRRKEAVII